MRLRQIRISGFKSFADLTVIDLTGSVIGIVGPNGCGKSNVFEAVQWAMGEARAGDLRAKQMAELIFSGSENRKPSSRAMVELIFENADKALPGPWGAFDEVSVRRVLTRDNVSAYFINGHAVRATDVRDLFMGTGLGANSYAIISQGRIEDFANATPEKRREYLEEAAGVSKYKKRRHEAELRLEDTRENLERARDIQLTRRERLERLTGQAEVARRYAELDARRSETESLFWYAQMRSARDASDALEARAAQLRLSLKQAADAFAKCELEASANAEALSKANITLLARSQAVSDIEREITALESRKREALARKEMLTNQVKNLETFAQRREEEIREAEAKTAFALEEKDAAAKALAAAREQRRELEAKAPDAERELREAEAASQKVLDQERELEKKASELSSSIASLTRIRDARQGDIAALAAERARQKAPDAGELARLAESLSKLEDEDEQAVRRIEAAEKELREADAASEAARKAFLAAREAAQSTRARLAAVSEIEERARTSGKLPEWIQKSGLGALAHLYETVEVEPAWARAFEAVLRERTQALAVTDVAHAAGFESLPPPVRLTFYEKAQEAPRAVDDTLASHVKGGDAQAALGLWLAGVFVAENLAQAREKLKGLPAGSRVVTPEGHVLDAVSVTFWAEDATLGNVLRRSEMAALRTKLEAEEKQERQAADKERLTREKRSLVESGLAEQRTARRALEASLRQMREAHHRLESEIQVFERHAADMQAFELKAKKELEETLGLLEKREALFDETDARLAVSQEASAAAQNALEERRQARAKLSEGIRQCQEREAQARARGAFVEERLATARQAALKAQEDVARLAREKEELAGKLKELEAQREAQDASPVLARLEASRAARIQAQEALAGVEQAALALAEKRRAAQESQNEAQRMTAEVLSERQRREIELASARARLPEGADETALALAYEDKRPKIPALKRSLDVLVAQMAELGPVNHAALAELEAEKALVDKVDGQIADLEEALGTIEAAIRKIDAETRAVLAETFEKVNAAFGRIFQTLFKGGEAYLTMTEEDVLACGIEMYASPPGKKLRSMLQLSGGELTLTATALVFAFFTLNPAPFCLLDEADAPLDEANQERLAGLITTMSENTQFMTITHHRVSMEHMTQLIGVTMREAGVSRVVSVDMREARDFVDDKRV